MLETFTSLRSDQFPDGTDIMGYVQGEEFYIPITAEIGGVEVNIASDAVRATAEFYLGRVRVVSDTELSISNMRLISTGITNPRQLDVTFDANNRHQIHVPTDFYTPVVARNEVDDVPVAAIEIRLVRGGETRKDFVGAIVRRGNA